jgi:uncharacterized membrane protein YbhN (UPF0104 family)
MKKRLRLGLSLLIVALTIAEFAYYLSRHSYLLHRLGQTPASTVAWLLLLFVIIFGVLGLVLDAGLRICGVTMPPPENLLLNAYSLLVNFFMIGQAGPGVRAIYLKRRYKLPIRRYIFSTLLYYACYAIVSILLVLGGSSLPWWVTVLVVVLTAVACIVVIQLYSHRKKLHANALNLSPSTLGYLLLATVLQAIVQMGIFAVELHSVKAGANLRQIMAYTGVANLALFVGLTPGAIGIRESFLLFSERLHHISSANIVAASVIDRSVYILFLGLLFLIILAFHAKTRFSPKDSA